jgi:hypothetical protein
MSWNIKEITYDSVGKATLHQYRFICCRLCPAFFVATWYHRSTLPFFFFFFYFYMAIFFCYFAFFFSSMPFPPFRGHLPSTCFPNISLLNFRGEGIVWHNKPCCWQRSVAAQTVSSEVLQSRNSVRVMDCRIVIGCCDDHVIWIWADIHTVGLQFFSRPYTIYLFVLVM